MIPTQVKHRKSEGRLELVYADGSRFNLSAEYLRVHSPSAEVRGHGPGQEILQHGKAGVRIARVEAVGRYALMLHFDDGHNTGIFSWQYLRDLGEHHDQYWQNYLDQLNQQGLSRDADLQPVKFITPPTSL